MHTLNFKFQQWYQSHGFHMLKIDIHILKRVEFQNLIFSWYMRCIDESLNLKFNFRFDIRTYSWYVKACIYLNFDLEWFLVHVHMICRWMHKLEILYDLIHDSFIRYMIICLDHKITLIWSIISIWDIWYHIVNLNFI